MDYSKQTNYMKGFLPYALAAFLVGIVGGLSTMLGPAFMLDMNLAYNNTTWSALAMLFLIEKKAKNPILIGAFMARKAFIMPVIILFLTQGLMQANMTNTIVFVNYTHPTNTAISGYAISIMYIGMSLGSILLGPLADRFEPKRILTGSLLLTGLGCGTMLFFTQATTFFLLATSLGILGLGLGGNIRSYVYQ